MIADTTSLYTAWLGAMADGFGLLMPKPATAASAEEQTTRPLPFPVDQVGRAIDLLGGLVTQLYQAYLPLLAKGEGGAPAFDSLAGTVAQGFEKMSSAWIASASALPLAGTNGSAAKWPQAGAWELGFERGFGGVLDAFGLRPTRELEQALREMLLAGAEQQRAQLEYLRLVGQAWNNGTQAFLQDLPAKAARGERIESLIAFIRAWAKAIDQPLHETMQSERGLQATARVVRAATKYRSRLQTAVGLVSDALQVPTRAEMDDAYREIQELKRELRRLRKALPAAERAAASSAVEVQQ